MKIQVSNISKKYGSTDVLRDVSLTIERNELFFLLGPSGCGKTTLLRILAGFISPDKGEILFNDKRVNHLPPERRRIPLVFQNYALWPHFTVFENVAYGLRIQNLPDDEIKRKTMEALEITHMVDFHQRYPNQLSGGQQQRVALSRALAIDPEVMLFDEPLSNLDPKLRTQMRQELMDIHLHRPFTAIYVTHDQEEAIMMASRIALLEKGLVHQVGTPQELFSKPNNAFVAEFMGPINWIPVKVKESRNSNYLVFETPLGELRAPPVSFPIVKDQDLMIGFRPSAVTLTEKGAISELITMITNRSDKLLFESEIVRVQYAGNAQQLTVRSITSNSRGELRFQIIESNPRAVRKVGERVEVGVESRDLITIPKK